MPLRAQAMTPALACRAASSSGVDTGWKVAGMPCPPTSRGREKVASGPPQLDSWMEQMLRIAWMMRARALPMR